MKMQPSTDMMLIHIHGPMKGNIQEFPEGSVSIGRHPSCAVRFPSDERNSVSRKHAEISREGNRFKLIDHSTNGTYLNGKKVSEAYLKDGDVLEFSEGGPKVSFITKVVESPDSVEAPPIPEYTTSQDMPELSRQPVASLPEDFPAGKVTVPLVIQFGPSLRSYRELPVTIGSNPASDFVIMHPSILGQHAQITFARGQYWIKDLTGQDNIRINNAPIDFQRPLNVNDLVSLVSRGPALRFLGEGRFAEAEEPLDMAGVEADTGNSAVPEKRDDESGGADGLWAMLKKKF